MEPIITSLLETDMYKFSMGQAIYHSFSGYNATWAFACRNKNVHFTKEMVEEIKSQIKHYCTLSFKEDELKFLDSITWIKGSYVSFLKLWHPCYDDFEISCDSPCGLKIQTRGTWLNTSMYEIPTLAIVNEVYYKMAFDYDDVFKSFKNRLSDKVSKLQNGTYKLGYLSEFGIRRRLSAEAQELALSTLLNSNLDGTTIIGTSNVYLAYKLGIKPSGTMAHEWIMCVGQGNHRQNPAYSNWYALDAWVREYGVLNGIALTDTITTDCFLRDFRLTFATLFNGVRHDSGDPYLWGDKMIEHYKSLNIDPMSKSLIFSDSLNFEKASSIYSYFKDRIKVSFGIGTYISNDSDYGSLNIVMKPVLCNGMDVAKISDVEGKGMCLNDAYVEYLKRCIDWRMKNDR